MSTIPKPTPGRTVLVAVQIGEGIATLPMIVSHVHEDMEISGVLQSAFADAGVHAGGTKPMQHLSYGPSGKTPNTWRWMDYQLGQAAKTEAVGGDLAARVEKLEAQQAMQGKGALEMASLPFIERLAEQVKVLEAQLIALNQKQPASQRVLVADPSLMVDGIPPGADPAPEVAKQAEEQPPV